LDKIKGKWNAPYKLFTHSGIPIGFVLRVAECCNLFDSMPQIAHYSLQRADKKGGYMSEDDSSTDENKMIISSWVESFKNRALTAAAIVVTIYLIISREGEFLYKIFDEIKFVFVLWILIQLSLWIIYRLTNFWPNRQQSWKDWQETWKESKELRLWVFVIGVWVVLVPIYYEITGNYFTRIEGREPIETLLMTVAPPAMLAIFRYIFVRYIK